MNSKIKYWEIYMYMQYKFDGTKKKKEILTMDLQIKALWRGEQ